MRTALTRVTLFASHLSLIFVSERKSSVEAANKVASSSAQASVASQLSSLETTIQAAVAAQQAQLEHLSEGLADLMQRKESDLPAVQQAAQELRALFEQETGRALAQVRQHVESSAERRGNEDSEETAAVERAQADFVVAVQEAGGTLKRLQGALDSQHEQVTALVQQQREVRTGKAQFR